MYISVSISIWHVCNWVCNLWYSMIRQECDDEGNKAWNDMINISICIECIVLCDWYIVWPRYVYLQYKDKYAMEYGYNACVKEVYE